MKVIFDYNDEQFAYNVLPKLISKRIMENYKLCTLNNQDNMMSLYIEKYYNMPLYNCIKEISNSLVVNKNGSSYVVEIDINKKYNGNNLYSLSRLIDYGTLNVKGINVIDSALRYVQNNIDYIYNVYVKGGLLYGC